MQGFSGGKFCKSDESRLSWAAGVRPPERAPQPAAGRRQPGGAGGWAGAHAGEAGRAAAGLSAGQGRGGRRRASLRLAAQGRKTHVQYRPKKAALGAYSVTELVTTQALKEMLRVHFPTPMSLPLSWGLTCQKNEGW